MQLGDTVTFGRQQMAVGVCCRRQRGPNVRWSWSLYGIVLTRPPGIQTDGHAPTLEAAKAEFKRDGSDGWSGRG
jgi:hypothetical protein